MSADVEIFFHSPQDLVWNPSRENDLRSQYRLLDAPLARDLIGLGRLISATPAIENDWDWSLTWQENKNRGALPSSQQLAVSRFTQAVFYPISLLFIFLIGNQVKGRRLAWLAMITLATNSLVMLHTRRAMAESILLAAILFSLWFFLSLKSRLWLFAIPSALAFSAKHSSAVIAAIAGILLLTKLIQQKSSPKKVGVDLMVFGLLFGLVTLLLNPFLWGNPIQAGIASLQARQELVNRQVSELSAIETGMFLSNVPQRILALTANLFITPPAIADVGNYSQDTLASSQAYLTNPMHNLMRGMPGGALMILLNLFGFISLIRNLLYVKARKDSALIVLLTGTAQAIFLLVYVPLPFQRYVMPLVPFACLFAACGVDSIIQFVIEIKQRQQATK